jgi:protein ImuB
MFSQLPLTDLSIEQDTLNVFNDLGLHRVEDLLAVPNDELIDRYGQQFRDVIDTIEQKGVSLLVPNVKESKVSWSFQLDNAVEDFEQLIFVLNHGLERLFAQVEHCGFSTEHLDLQFKLRNRTEKAYEIKTSFPTLERAFWLKLINLRASLDPPDASITAVDVTAHFTKARHSQRGLYAVSRPEPESLLLTAGKLKKLVGEQNVGVPVILDQRLAEPFGLEAAGGIAAGDVRAISEKHSPSENRAEPRGIVAFIFYRPPIRAEVLVRDRHLIYLKTRYFAGHIANVSGVWKGNSKWWDRSWRTHEWDVEVENGGVYRLCKAGDGWFVVGEYD